VNRSSPRRQGTPLGPWTRFLWFIAVGVFVMFLVQVVVQSDLF
jgi:hypothetical protein